MQKIPDDMITGTHHMTNTYGELEVVEYNNHNTVRVKFLATGYEPVVRAGNIRRGKVKDLLVPSVYGVGYVGDGGFAPSIDRKPTKTYKTWASMLQRCYDKKFQAGNPTYTDCSVDPEWHNFQNFAEWMSKQDYRGKELDKDIKVKGNEVYSPETCMFVTQAENAVDANAKNHVFISPTGEKVEIYNLNEFCRENMLNTSNMCLVRSGKRKQHKGWTKHED